MLASAAVTAWHKRVTIRRMEEQKTAPRPVMDVVPQHAAAAAAGTGEGLAKAPPPDPADPVDQPASVDPPADKPVAHKPPKAPRQPGVAGAITATVVIALGLGVLTVYAYLRSSGVSLF